MENTAEYPASLFSSLLKQKGIVCVSAELITGGSNNLIHRIICEDGSFLLAKKYFVDDRQRLAREFQTLSLLRENGFTEVPQPIERFDKQNAGVYEFISGRHIFASEFSDRELIQIAEYLAKIHSLTKKEVKKNLPKAFTAAFSLADALKAGRKRLMSVNKNFPKFERDVQQFVMKNMVIERVDAAFTKIAKQLGDVKMYKKINPEHERLSSVDFGPHNMLWREDDSLTVIDFEYAGWDHPMRIISDMLSHDKMRDLPNAKKSLFVAEYLKRTPLPYEVTNDLADFRRIAQVEWVAILLSSILPEKREKLIYANGGSFEMNTYCVQQIEKIQERMRCLPGLLTPH